MSWLSLVWTGFWPQLPVPVAKRPSVNGGTGSLRLFASLWQWAGGREEQEAGGRPQQEVHEGELGFLLLWQALGRWSHSASGHQEGKVTTFCHVNRVIIYSPPCWWKVGGSFKVHRILLKLHSKTALQLQHPKARAPTSDRVHTKRFWLSSYREDFRSLKGVNKVF